MRFRFRKTDLFAVAGVVLLLAWVPSYVAQDPEARAIADGRTFALPAPRAGDYVEFELVVRWEGKPALVMGPVANLTYRTAVRGETPFAAAFVEEWRYARAEWNFTGGSVSFYGPDASIYYGRDGLPLWADAGKLAPPGLARPTDDATPWGRPREGLASALTSALNAQHRLTLDYEPSVARAAAAQANAMAQYLLTDGEGGIDRPSHAAADHRGMTLYGSDMVISDAWDRWFDIGVTTLYQDDHDGRGLLMFQGPWLNHHNLWLDPAPDQYADEAWDWYSPRAAQAVGTHFGLARRGEDAFFTADIVPRLIVRGDGEELQVRTVQDWEGFGTTARTDRPLASVKGLETIALRDLQNDTRPLVGNITLPYLREVLSSHGAPAPLSSALDQEGWIFAFAGPQRNEWGPTPPTHERWQVAIDRGDRTYLAAIVSFNVTVDPPAPERYEVRCGDPQSEVPQCPLVNGALLRPERRVLDPWAVWGQGAREGAVRTSVAFVPAPWLTEWGYQSGPAHDPSNGTARAAPAAMVVGVPDYVHGVPSEALLTTGGFVKAVYEEAGGPDTASFAGYWSLADGALEWHRVTGTSSVQQVRPTLTPLVDPTAMHRLDVSATSVGWGALGFIMLSVGARLAAAFAQGAHFGAVSALYARIGHHQVLDNKRRAEIAHLLQADPGLTLTEIRQRLGYAWGVAVHHIDRLHKEGLIAPVQNGRRRHWFPTDDVLPERRREIIAARDGDLDAFLAHVRQQPGVTLQAIGERLSVHRSRASRLGSRLVELWPRGEAPRRNADALLPGPRPPRRTGSGGHGRGSRVKHR